MHMGGLLLGEMKQQCGDLVSDHEEPCHGIDPPLNQPLNNFYFVVLNGQLVFCNNGHFSYW